MPDNLQWLSLALAFRVLNLKIMSSKAVVVWQVVSETLDQRYTIN